MNRTLVRIRADDFGWKRMNRKLRALLERAAAGQGWCNGQYPRRVVVKAWFSRSLGTIPLLLTRRPTRSGSDGQRPLGFGFFLARVPCASPSTARIHPGEQPTGPRLRPVRSWDWQYSRRINSAGNAHGASLWPEIRLVDRASLDESRLLIFGQLFLPGGIALWGLLQFDAPGFHQRLLGHILVAL